MKVTQETFEIAPDSCLSHFMRFLQRDVLLFNLNNTASAIQRQPALAKGPIHNGGREEIQRLPEVGGLQVFLHEDDDYKFSRVARVKTRVILFVK